MDTARDVLRDAKALGLRLYLKDGQIRGRPASIATPELRARIDALRGEVVSLLRSLLPMPTQLALGGSALPAGIPKPTTQPLTQADIDRRMGRGRSSFSGQRAPREVNDLDRAVFAAWDAALGFTPGTAETVIESAKHHPTLHAALEAVAPGSGGIDARRLSSYLASLRESSSMTT
jgi:hypothetical protein